MACILFHNRIHRFTCGIYLNSCVFSGEKDATALLTDVAKLVKSVHGGETSLNDALKSDALTDIQDALDDWCGLMQTYGTAKLWMQYQRMVAILRTLIRSVRVGSWTLYLQSLCDMHPYLAAAGHNNYTKSLALFIPRMLDLEKTHPDVYAHFMKGLFPIRRTDGVWSGIFTDLFIEQVLMAGIKSTGGLTHGRGFDESTRLIFLLSRPICAEVSQSIFDIAGLSLSTGDGHRELAASRIRRDMSDIQRLVQFLVERGPFDKTSKKIVSLSTGLVAEDSVNADDAKGVGKKILNLMVGHSVASYKFSQKNQVKTLASAVHVQNTSGDRIEMEPQRLYQRLLLTGIGVIQLDELLKYELCSFPPSFFDNHMRMRSGDKAELIHHLVKLNPTCIVSGTLEVGLQYIVDGGGLLHKFAWPKHSTYSDICSLYVRHIHSTYGHAAMVVFDGYHGSSTKDEAHRRRTGHDIGAKVLVSAEMQLTMSKKAFLANESNKQALINLLAGEMVKSNIAVEHAEGDADYKISMLACFSASTKPTAVVAEDSDIFQLLLHHADIKDGSCNLYMLTTRQVVCITGLKKNIDPALSEALLFLHAVSGCDTTSRPYGIGKVTVLTKYAALKNSISVFMSPCSSKGEITKAGLEALLEIYGCQTSPSLTSARVMKFQQKVATSAGYVPPEKLPPTDDAASFHAFRTYHQVQAWRGNDISPEAWGWIESPPGLMPVRMTQPAAPEQLLKIIRCNCGGQCEKRSCTCRKNGLLCTPACGQCKGITCSNGPQVNDCDVDVDIEDDQ